MKTERLMGEFGDSLMLWGSSRVVKAWVALRRLAAQSQPSTSEQIAAYGRMLLAIRKEFGHDDWALSERDLFRIVFNDELDTLMALPDSDAEAIDGRS